MTNRKTRQNPLATARDLTDVTVLDAGNGQVQFSIGGVPGPAFTVPAAAWSTITGKPETLDDLDDPLAARAAIGAERKQSFNVREFGAVGDGVADDTEAIQDAINAAIDAGGGRVFLDAGDYKLTTHITVGDGVELAGVGSASRLLPIYATRGSNSVIRNDWVNGNSNIILRHFLLYRGTPGSEVEHGILLNGVDNLLIDGIEMDGRPTHSRSCGLLSISGVGPETGATPSTNVRIVNCHFRESGNFGCHFGWVDGGIMANNVAYVTDREIFGVEPYGGGGESKNITIANNTIYGKATVQGTRTGLIVITTSSGGPISGVAIVGNVIRQQEPRTHENRGITVLGATNVTITGNVVYGMGSEGLSIGDLDEEIVGAVIQGNSITECGLTVASPGIALRNAKHCVISGNYIHGSEHTSGIDEQQGAQNNLITGNILRDSVPFNVASSTNGSVVFNNKVTVNDSSVSLGHPDISTQDFILNRSASETGRTRIAMQRNSVNRWFLDCAGSEAAGSNAGSDFTIQARANDGTLIGNALSINRATRRMTAEGIFVNGTIELGNTSDTTLQRTSAGMVSVEGNPLATRVAVPGAADATGVVGHWAADSSWLYICIATNVWRRVAIAAW